MDQSTDDVQRDRERTRSAISEKIELLEERIRDTVMDAKTAVKQSLDLRYHVNRRPWQMVGLSVVAGFLVGRWIADRNRDWPEREFASPNLWREGQETEFEESSGEKAYSALRTEPMSSRIFDQFRDELTALKGAAIGAVVSVVRDFLRSVTSSVTETTGSKPTSTDSGQTRLH